jgi:NAD(P)-dependent dehydrogenase (short-subunit alcohol dehydrogenase family)
VVAADVREADQVRAMVAQAVARYGKLDIAVNNVGGALGAQRFLDYEDSLWDAVLARNLKSTFHCCQAEARAMIAGGVTGRIINISSGAGVVPLPNIVAYGAAKAGVIQLTRTLAIELAPHRIRVNCILPGDHRVERYEPAQLDEGQRAYREAVAASVPLGYIGEPLETGGVAVFFASKLSAYVTGQALASDGGAMLTSARPEIPPRR